MTCAVTQNLTICKGKTFSWVIRWEDTEFEYKPISGITQGAPVSITATGHGLRTGWRAAVTSVKGMTQINAQNTPPKEKDYHVVTRVDDNTVTLNDTNSAGYKAYPSGGYLQYYKPVSLSGCTPRMQIRDKVGGTLLLELFAGTNLVPDVTENTLTIQIDAATTAALDWKKGVYDLEIDFGGVVTALYEGAVTVEDEVTI